MENIKDALQSDLSQSSDLYGSSHVVDEYKRDVEKLIEDGSLTNEQFSEYTMHYCWYCGRKYSSVDGERHIRNYAMTRTERTTKGLRNIITTYTRTIHIPECTECNKYHKVIDSAKKTAKIISYTIIYTLAAIPIGYMTYLFKDEGLVMMLLFAGMCIGMLIYLHRVFRFLGSIFVTPFLMCYCAIKKRAYPFKLRNERQVPLVKAARKDGFHKQRA